MSSSIMSVSTVTPNNKHNNNSNAQHADSEGYASRDRSTSTCNSVGFESERTVNPADVVGGTTGSNTAVPISMTTTNATANASETASETNTASSGSHRNHGRDSEIIEKAIKFWNHPSLSSIPTQEKINYLKSKGLSDDDIHQVWEKLVDDNDHQPSIVSDGGTDTSRMAIPQVGSSVSPGHRTNSTVTTTHVPTAPYVVDGPQSYPQRSLQNDAAVYDETPHTMALLTIGGMLGLTAAAAVRWLNGGDFYLFPPATAATTTTTTTATTASITSTNTNHNKASDDHVIEDQDENCNTDDSKKNRDPQQSSYDAQQLEKVISRQIEELKTIVQAQNESHDRVLHSLTAQQAKRMTDQSMTLLKRSQRMERIKSLLESLLPHDKDDTLKKAIAMVNECLDEEKEDTVLQQQQHRQDDVMVAVSHRSTDAANRATVESSSNASILPQVIQRLVLENDATADMNSGCQVLYLYVTHLSSHPHVPRYRKIYTSNGSFQKVEKLAGGLDLLLAVGFTKFDGYLEWQPQNEQEALKTLQAASMALSILKNNNNINNNSSSTVGDSEPPTKESLCAMALAALPTRSGTPTSFSPTTSIREEDQNNITNTNNCNNNDIIMKTPSTPEVGNHLVSPPMTKKHPNAVVHSFLPTPYAYPNTPNKCHKDLQPTHDEIELPSSSSSSEAASAPIILPAESSSQQTSHDPVVMEQLPITAFQPILSQSQLPPSKIQPSRREE
jgi:hypothetical protein